MFLMDFFCQGPYYFLTIANLFDLLLIVGHGVVFGLYVAKSWAFSDLEFGPDHQYVDLR